MQVRSYSVSVITLAGEWANVGSSLGQRLPTFRGGVQKVIFRPTYSVDCLTFFSLSVVADRCPVALSVELACFPTGCPGGGCPTGHMTSEQRLEVTERAGAHSGALYIMAHH